MSFSCFKRIPSVEWCLFLINDGVFMAGCAHTIDFQHLGLRDLEQVGGKNASLGEMISHLSAAGVTVPGGFATTADSFREF